MSKGIPEHIDLMRAANHEKRYQGVFEVGKMQRLAGLLADKKGQVEVDVQFGRNGQNHPYLKGSANGQFWLPCQRCMEPIQSDIDVSFELMLVGSQHQAERLTEDKDVLVVDMIPASFIEIVEDELLLGFPAVYMHNADECSSAVFMQDKREAQIEEKGERKPNPFDVLKDLKLDS